MQEAIGDFFEFVEFYFLARQRSDLPMSMTTNVTCRVYGRAKVEKAITYQNVAAAPAVTPTPETVLMMYDYANEGDSSDGERGNVNAITITELPSEPDAEMPCCEWNLVLGDEYMQCDTCNLWIHPDCCRPIMPDEWQNCKIGRFQLYFPRGHNPEVRLADAVNGHADAL